MHGWGWAVVKGLNSEFTQALSSLLFFLLDQIYQRQVSAFVCSGISWLLLLFEKTNYCHGCQDS